MVIRRHPSRRAQVGGGGRGVPCTGDLGDRLVEGRPVEAGSTVQLVRHGGENRDKPIEKVPDTSGQLGQGRAGIYQVPDTAPYSDAEERHQAVSHTDPLYREPYAR